MMRKWSSIPHQALGGGREERGEITLGSDRKTEETCEDPCLVMVGDARLERAAFGSGDRSLRFSTFIPELT